MALGPPPLNIWPLGLLDLFQIKNGGEYPQTLGNQLQPEIDMLQWYAETNAEEYGLSRAAITANTGAQGLSWATTTPANKALFPADGEIWIVTQYDVRWTMAADDANSRLYIPGIMVAKGAAGTNRFVPAQTSFSTTAQASFSTIITAGQVSLLGPIFLRPGDSVGILHNGFVAGVGASLQYSGFIRYARCGVR